MAEKKNLSLVDKSVTVDGIKVNVHVDPTNDYEFAVCSVIMNDVDASDIDKSKALIRSHKIILGNEYSRVLDDLRKKHGGELSTSTVVAFINKVTDKIAALKNSES